MKIFLLTIFYILNANAFAPILTQEDQVEVLKIIDHDCADTWCAGDYEYKFSTFTCNETKSTCTLSFKIIDRDDSAGTTNYKNKRCIFKGITGKDKIIFENSLTEEFYEELNNCISSRSI